MKGNMFLGYARGSVGDVTFARQKGQQVARARNRQPANPRTIGQSMQRSLFANAVKFHSKGVQQLFKFAFEDKRPAESDYNAFMRHNIGSSVRISKYASESALYPAIGNWMMSYGSLRSVQLTFFGSISGNVWTFDCPSADSNMTTIGDLSKCLRTDFGLMEGDIVTLVYIIAVGATSANMPAIVPPSGLQGANWNMDQFRLDSASTESALGTFSFENGAIFLDRSNSSTDSYIQGMAVIFSRPRTNGLLVSTSYLVGNTALKTAIEASNEDAYIEQVLNSWQTAEQAILQGALLQSGTEPANLVTGTTPALPTNVESIEAALSRDNFYEDVARGQAVGYVIRAGIQEPLFVMSSGSTVAVSTTDETFYGEGMHTAGAKITFTNSGGQIISQIVIYDI